MVFMLILGYLFITLAILYYFGLKQFFSSDPLFLLIFGLVVSVYVPISIYFKSKKLFSSHQRIQELITYQFHENGVNVTGESFNSNFDWEKLYKIKKVRNWLLLYQSKIVANIIKLDSFENNDYEKLRKFLKAKNLGNISNI